VTKAECEVVFLWHDNKTALLRRVAER